jgi:hypothetical protein
MSCDCEQPVPTDYAPYHTMPEFDAGVADYGCGSPPLESLGGVRQQAYDRGLEYAMRVVRWNESHD